MGGRGPDAHDPAYNGYSVGFWEDDYTFVVETAGMADGTVMRDTQRGADDGGRTDPGVRQ